MRFLGPSSSELAGPSCVVALLLNLSGFLGFSFSWPFFL